MKIVKSKFFERDLRFLRVKLSFLNHIYNFNHGINFQSLPTEKYPEASQKAQKARIVLEQHLIPATLNIGESTSEIPKKLWLYWNSPLEAAPDVVKVSVQSWKEKNPDYDLVLLNDHNLNEFLGFDFNALFCIATVNLGFAMKADILRMYLLSMYGGVWVDTTTFCVRPLDEWLPNCTRQTGFFTFRHKSNKTRPIEAWFIASQQGHFVIRHVLALFLEHLFKARKQSLYIVHNMKSLGYSDKDGERLFADAVYAAEQHHFMPYFSVGYFFNEALRHEQAGNVDEILMQQPNYHAVNMDDMVIFMASYVSKQTYKKDYQETDLYRERRQYIFNSLKKA